MQKAIELRKEILEAEKGILDDVVLDLKERDSMDNVKNILENVKNGNISVDEALLKLKIEPFEDLGFAKIDHHRQLRQGIGEVVYGASKTPEQIVEITNSLLNNGQETVLITRMNKEAKEYAQGKMTFEYYLYLIHISEPTRLLSISYNIIS